LLPKIANKIENRKYSSLGFFHGGQRYRSRSLNYQTTTVRKLVLDALSINVNKIASWVGGLFFTTPNDAKTAHILTLLTAI
jgi:hypothetical protein